MKIAALLVLAAAAGVANAQNWTEVPDAAAAAINGPAPQNTVGVGPLVTIQGGGDFVGDTVDTYCIFITDPTQFRATTVGGSTQDTQLFLFDANGVGVAHNDDSAGGTRSTLTNLFTANLQPGLYVLAVSTYDVDPLGAAGGEIWSDTPFGAERAPDGPEAASQVFGWGGSGSTLTAYTITLNGASYCVPAPSALALVGIAGVFAGRRRR